MREKYHGHVANKDID